MVKKQDRRLQKTETAIKQALIDLIHEKEFNKITVTELSEKANVNRKTFYNHYDSVMAVMKSIEEEIAQNFSSFLKEISFVKNIASPKVIFGIINSLMSGELGGWSDDRNVELVRKIEDIMNEELYKYLKGLYNDRKARFVARFVISTLFAAYIEWSKNSEGYSEDEIADMVSGLILEGIKSL